MKDEDMPISILELMAESGVEVSELIEAGMDLLVGFERTKELDILLEKQILKSLEDINIKVMIVAGIRLEDDLLNHKIKGVNVDDDPSYLYADEVFGMAIANQIAGTKGIFNFKRYDEIKPGIIGVLGPILDYVFAGLVAGCMSKLFEE